MKLVILFRTINFWLSLIFHNRPISMTKILAISQEWHWGSFVVFPGSIVLDSKLVWQARDSDLSPNGVILSDGWYITQMISQNVMSYLYLQRNHSASEDYLHVFSDYFASKYYFRLYNLFAEHIRKSCYQFLALVIPNAKRFELFA